MEPVDGEDEVTCVILSLYRSHLCDVIIIQMTVVNVSNHNNIELSYPPHLWESICLQCFDFVSLAVGK